MPVKIKNLAPRSILLPLNSGITLRLSPGEVTGELNDAEIKENPKVQKMQGQRSISVEQLDDKSAAKKRKAAEAEAGAQGEVKAAAPEEDKAEPQPKKG